MPLALEQHHHGGVNRGAVHGPKGKDIEGVFLKVRRHEGKLFLRVRSDLDLVEATAGVERNEEDNNTAHTEIRNCIVAAWDRVRERKSNGVEGSVVDVHAPDELLDVKTLFLVRLGSEDDAEGPWTATKTNQAIVVEGVDLLHDFQ